MPLGGDAAVDVGRSGLVSVPQFHAFFVLVGSRFRASELRRLVEVRERYSPLARPEFEPAVVRIGPDRTLLDPPWGLRAWVVAHVWIDDAVSAGWGRVAWPNDAASGRPIAPLDLHLGHVLELSVQEGTRRDVLYACVAEADDRRMVLVPAAPAFDAVAMARHAVDIWRVSELAATEDSWRQRLATAQDLYRSST